MNRKNLSDAFGEIDENLFALAETESLKELLPKSSDNAQAPEFQAPMFIKNTGESKSENRKKALISATAGIAACVVLAVSLPLLYNNTAPPYGAAETTEALTQQPDPSETDKQTEQTEAITQPVTQELPQDPTQIELYTEVKEILNAEDVYNVERTQIDLSGFEENGLDEKSSLQSICSDTLIEGSSFFYAISESAAFQSDQSSAPEERYGYIFLYDMDTGEHTLILKERAYKKGNSLMLRPVYYVKGWLYYYYMEVRPTEELYQNDESELWRINIETKTKEKIAGMYEAFSGYKETIVKSGKYLYFTDPVYAIEPIDTHILRYDMEEGQLDIFKEANIKDERYAYPYLYKYKDGIIYSIDGINFYYHTDDGEPDEALPDLSSYYPMGKNYFQNIGNNALIYKRDIADLFDGDIESLGAMIGILDEDFQARDLAYLPVYAELANINTDLKLKVILTPDRNGFDNRILIYDMEADCFSELKLPSEKDNAVYCTEQGDELRILVYTGESNECDGMTLYTITKK